MSVAYRTFFGFHREPFSSDLALCTTNVEFLEILSRNFMLQVP